MEIVNALGAIAIFLSAFRFAAQQHINFMRLNMLAKFMLAAHFLSMGAMTGFSLALVAGARCGLLTTAFGWHHRNKVGLGALTAAAGLNIVFYTDPALAFLVLAPAIAIMADIQHNMFVLRCMYLLNHCIWLIYGVLTGSLPCIISESINISANLQSIYAFHIRPARQVAALE